MTDPGEARRLADAIIAMIKEDQDSGQVPRAVGSLDELDDSVDIEDYFRLAHMPEAEHDAAELRADVIAEVARRLEATQGGHWHVIWKQSGGPSADIGRTAGYRKKAEAEAIGREHVEAHGGRFNLRKV